MRSFIATLWNPGDVDQTASGANVGDAVGETSCPPWPVPHLNIRLQVIEDTVHIYGYPSETPEAAFNPSSSEYPGPHFLYVRGDTPAYIDFIVGNDWRHNLTSIDGQEGLVIPRATSTQADETSNALKLRDDEDQHCLRMRKCGAVFVSSQPEIAMRETRYYSGLRQPAERQMFGWPKEGGVWVLEAPVPTDELTLEEQMRMLEDDPEGAIRGNFRDAQTQIRATADMDALCDVLRRAGGQYYANAADCPAVRALEL